MYSEKFRFSKLMRQEKGASRDRGETVRFALGSTMKNMLNSSGKLFFTLASIHQYDSELNQTSVLSKQNVVKIYLFASWKVRISNKRYFSAPVSGH